MRLETEAWDEDTKTLKQVEEEIKKKGVTEDNYFELFVKVLNVSDRTSLGASNPEGKYYKRMLYCKDLMEHKLNKRGAQLIAKQSKRRRR